MLFPGTCPPTAITSAAATKVNSTERSVVSRVRPRCPGQASRCPRSPADALGPRMEEPRSGPAGERGPTEESFMRAFFQLSRTGSPGGQLFDDRVGGHAAGGYSGEAGKAPLRWPRHGPRARTSHGPDSLNNYRHFSIFRTSPQLMIAETLRFTET